MQQGTTQVTPTRVVEESIWVFICPMGAAKWVGFLACSPKMDRLISNGRVTGEPYFYQSHFLLKATLCWRNQSIFLSAHVDSGADSIHVNRQVAAPLSSLTSPSFLIVRSPEANSAFSILKTRFTSAPVLTHPDPSRQFIVEVDSPSGDSGVGVLCPPLTVTS